MWFGSVVLQYGYGEGVTMERERKKKCVDGFKLVVGWLGR